MIGGIDLIKALEKQSRIEIKTREDFDNAVLKIGFTLKLSDDKRPPGSPAPMEGDSC